MIWGSIRIMSDQYFHGLDYRTLRASESMFSGEVMPPKHLKAWMEHLPEADFINLYGPTEITCNCTYHRIDRNRDYSEGVPVGCAFPNEHVFLLDDNNQEVTKPGIAGEICVRGTALALGYYRMPEQTAEHFVQNPLNHCYPELIYRTGDLGRYNEQGEILFGGRKDYQVKYMGHRIELEEIERAMENIEGISRACCIFDEKKSKLYGFYMGEMEKKELHHLMSSNLPPFMVPGALRKVEQMPLTKNGKTDRRALMEKHAKGARS